MTPTEARLSLRLLKVPSLYPGKMIFIVIPELEVSIEIVEEFLQ